MADLTMYMLAEAKLVASDVANDVCRAAVQFMGGYGYCREYGVERKLRDVKITEIYEGYIRSYEDGYLWLFT